MGDVAEEVGAEAAFLVQAFGEVEAEVQIVLVLKDFLGEKPGLEPFRIFGEKAGLC